MEAVVEEEVVRVVEVVLEVELERGAMDVEVGLVTEEVRGTVLVEQRRQGMVEEEEEVAVEVAAVV
jgi:hypothetical protein